MGKGENNFTAKVFALTIAIVLWSYVMSVENPFINKEYKNVVVNLYNTSELERQGLTIIEPEEVRINVKVRGKSSDMKDFSSSNIVAEIDLSGYDEGQVRVPVTTSLVGSTSNISIVDWEPREIVFTLDKTITQEKSVTVEVQGDLEDEYVLGDITSDPQQVQVRGPRTLINEIAEVKAVADITGQTSTTNRKVSIQILDVNGNQIKGLEGKPDVVNVNIPILRKHTLPIRLQTEGELPDGYILSDIKINPSIVAVKGSESILNHTHINTETVNVSDLIGNTSINVELDPPEDVELLNPDEKISISYSIEEVDSSNLSYNISNIDIRNLKEDLNIDLENTDSTVEIQLEGSQSDLNKINPRNIKAYIDLKDLDEGSHQVDIEIENIEGINIKNINPKTIKVDLKPRDEEG